MGITEHLEQTRDHDLHIEGEANGCLVFCFKYGSQTQGKHGHSHRHNGRQYQEQNESEYYNLDFTSGTDKAHLDDEFGSGVPMHSVGDPRLKADAWHMKVGANFCHSKAPWPNQAHHVIPINIIGKVFPKLEELALLLVAKYNLNRGLNIIILPYLDTYGRVMGLPVHRGSHARYDIQVETRLRSIRRGLTKAEDPQRNGHPELTKDNVLGITTDIENFARRLRKMLLLSRSRARGVNINDALRLFSSQRV